MYFIGDDVLSLTKSLLDLSGSSFWAFLSLLNRHPMKNNYNQLIIKINQQGLMQRNEISPWSIYNQTIHQQDSESPQKQKRTIFFPKIQKPITQRHRVDNQNQFKRRHSALVASDKLLVKKEEIESVAPDTFQNQRRQSQQQIKFKQLEIGRLFEDCIIVKLIKEELKREASERNFLYILQQQREKQQTKEAPIQIMKKDRSYLLDHHAFPKLSIDRNMMLVNMSNIESNQKKELSQDDIRNLLKKQIGSMISNRMKIMGKSKQLASKP